MLRLLRLVSLFSLLAFLISFAPVYAQDWESDGVNGQIDFISSNGRGLDFTSNSDGSHWLWFHDDGSSNATVYGAQLYSTGDKVWRIVDRSNWNELVHVGPDGRFYVRGKVGVGTGSPSEKLSVAGNVLAEEIIVRPQDQWADFVFENGYNLPTLKEVSRFIEKKGHLPSVPSAESVKKNGLRLGEMDATLLQKVEELTLYAIKQKKRADSLASQTDALSKTVQRLRSRNKVQRNRSATQQKQIDALKRRNEELRRRLDRLEQRVRDSSPENR